MLSSILKSNLSSFSKHEYQSWWHPTASFSRYYPKIAPVQHIESKHHDTDETVQIEPATNTTIETSKKRTFSSSTITFDDQIYQPRTSYPKSEKIPDQSSPFIDSESGCPYFADISKDPTSFSDKPILQNPSNF